MSDTYLFQTRVIAADPTGYYHPRWDKALPVQVIAKTRAEAWGKAEAVMGRPPSGREWRVRIDSVEPFVPPRDTGEDQ